MSPIFSGVVPPSAPHPFAASSPPSPTTAASSPSPPPFFGASAGGGGAGGGGFGSGCGRCESALSAPARFLSSPLSGLGLGAALPGTWQDPTALRRSDLEVLLHNLRVHIEERFEEQSRTLADIAAEQHALRDLQETCLSSLEPITQTDWPGLLRRNLADASRTYSKDSDDLEVSTDRRGAGFVASGGVPQLSPSQVGMAKDDSGRPKGRSPVRPIDGASEECWVDGQTRFGSYLRKFEAFVEATTFDYAMGLVIVLNTIFLGIQLDLKVWNLREGHGEKSPEPIYFSIIETVFAVIFLFEVIARLIAQRRYFFLSGWNLFDTFVVASALLEECIKYGVGGDTIAGRLSVFRIVRVAKLLRTLRIIRVVRAFRELRIVLASMIRSLRALVWTFSLFFVLIYFMTVVILVELTNVPTAFEGDDTAAVLRRQYFSSVSRSLVTVYQACTGGVLWGDASTSLEAVMPWVSALWIIFVSLTFFAITNVVTGIFVDQAMKSAHDDMTNVEVEEYDKREGAAKSLLHTIMQCIGTGQKGLDRSTLVKICKDRAAVMCLSKADIDPRDICTFFDIVAGDRKMITTKELEGFVRSCFRLKGFARNIDVAAVAYQQRRILKR